MITVFDGEGIGEKYVVLASLNNDGYQMIADKRGLSIDVALDFLSRDCLISEINVWYSFGYDVSMMLGEIKSEDFWTGARAVRYKKWKITYRPGRMLIIKKDGLKAVRHYDIFSIFNSSFLEACKNWQVEVDPLVEIGKRARRDFGKWSIDDLKRYNSKELVALLELSKKVFDLIEAAIGALRSYHGSGAIGDAIIAQSRLRDEVANEIQPVDVDLFARHAYFGGRIELIKRGENLRGIRQYDLNAAYPAAIAAGLPDLSTCAWRHVDDYVSGRIGLYAVRFLSPAFARIGVLPIRRVDRSVFFPQAGFGIYWNYEIEAAKRAGARVSVLSGWTITRYVESSITPVVKKLFDERKKYHALGASGEEAAIKIGLNSLYGKISQRPIGAWRGNGQSLVLAGLITARVRAALLDAVRDADQDQIIGFATDGVFCQCDLAVDISGSYGAWKIEKFERGDFVQSGFYRLLRAREIKEHTRGYMRGEIDWRKLLIDLKKRGTHEIRVTRFVNALLAARSDARVGWIDETREIDPESDHKRAWIARWSRKDYKFSWPLRGDTELSRPYSPIPYRRIAGEEVIDEV